MDTSSILPSREFTSHQLCKNQRFMMPPCCGIPNGRTSDFITGRLLNQENGLLNHLN